MSTHNVYFHGKIRKNLSDTSCYLELSYLSYHSMLGKISADNILNFCLIFL